VALLHSVAVAPGSLVGTNEFVPEMPSHPQLHPDGYEVVIDQCGPGEWIVAVPGHDRPLHVYRLGPADWLVSEVGRSSEGRGGDLSRALAALAAGAALVVWGRLVADALDAGGEAP
jgi:sarcosine oxidase gamma subunit